MIETPILTKISKSKYDHSCHPVVAHKKRNKRDGNVQVTCVHALEGN